METNTVDLVASAPAVPQHPETPQGLFKVQPFKANAKANTGNENCVCICVCQ